MSVEDRLERWIAGQLEVVPTAIRFSLYAVEQLAEKKQHSVKTGPGTPAELASSIRKEMMTQAENGALASLGVVKYKVYALIRTKGGGDPDENEKGEKGKLEKRAHFPFVMRGKALASQTGNGETIPGHEAEPPNEKGTTAMLMRHVETKEARINELVDNMLAFCTNEVVELRKRVVHYENRDALMREHRENLLNEVHRRQLELIQTEGDEGRKNALVGMAVKEIGPKIGHYIPAVMQKIGLGNGEAPPAVDQEANNLRAFVSELSKEELDSLLSNIGTLPPEKQKKLAAILGLGG